jgi:hypothetical protein
MAISRAWIGEGSINWPQFPLEMNLLQYKIINTLANLPVLEYKNALMIKGSAILNVGDSRLLP